MERRAALTSRLQWSETELLTQAKSRAGLACINRKLCAKAQAIASPRPVVLDLDPTEVPVYGRQETSAYNDHFESTYYHPLLPFNGEDDCLEAKLRWGNFDSAEGWVAVLQPAIEQLKALGIEVTFRGDAAFARPEIYEALEEDDVKCVIRLPADDSLQRNVTELLKRPAGRPSYRP